MKFVMSYSCGKDSTLALHTMLAQGHEAVALIVVVHEDAQRSFFHGVDKTMLEQISSVLDIPLLLTPTSGERYHLAMEESLRKAKELGAEAACFGDIDIEDHRAWCEARSLQASLKAVFPLWQRDRRENVFELLRLGYRCLIKTVNSTLLPRTLLGKIIDHEVVEEMDHCGIDICGENGEYHTIVVDGPIFTRPVAYTLGEILNFGDMAVINVQAR